eukprot:gene1776-2085_t
MSGWTSGPILPKALCFGACASLSDGSLFISGGGLTMWQGSTVFSSCYLLQEAVRTESEPYQHWSSSPSPMLSSRCGHTAITLLNGNVLVCGGYGGQTSYLSSTEIFDPQRNQWVAAADMRARRTGLGASLGPCGAVYALGGSADGLTGDESMERYDPREGKWRTCCPMKMKRCYYSACFGGSGILYAMGGVDVFDNPHLNLVHCFEWYDRRADAWSSIPLALRDLVNIREFDTHRADHQMIYLMP